MSIAPGGMGPGAGAGAGGGGSSNADAAQLRREMGVKEQRCCELEKAKVPMLPLTFPPMPYK